MSVSTDILLYSESAAGSAGPANGKGRGDRPSAVRRSPAVVPAAEENREPYLAHPVTVTVVEWRAPYASTYEIAN